MLRLHLSLVGQGFWRKSPTLMGHFDSQNGISDCSSKFFNSFINGGSVVVPVWVLIFWIWWAEGFWCSWWASSLLDLSPCSYWAYLCLKRRSSASVLDKLLNSACNTGKSVYMHLGKEKKRCEIWDIRSAIFFSHSSLVACIWDSMTPGVSFKCFL